MNKWTGTGNIARDIESRFTQSGMAVASFSVAINSRRKQGEEYIDEVDFFDVTFFGKKAEAIAKYFHKGSKILIMGKLKTDSWDCAKTGQKRYKTFIIGEEFEFMDKKGDNAQQSQNNAPNSYSQPLQATTQGVNHTNNMNRPAAQTPPPMNAFVPPESEIPF